MKIIRARKWTIIQAVAVIVFVAAIATALQRPVYQGESQILITNANEGAAIFTSDYNRQTGTNETLTQVQIVTSQPVLERAARSIHPSTTPTALFKQVSVAEVGQTNVLTVTATDGEPVRAASIATAVANAYVEWSAESKRGSIEAAAKEVEKRLQETQNEILDLGAQIQNNPAAKPQLDARLSIATGKNSVLAQKLEELRVNAQLEVGNGQVTRDAVVSTRPVSPKPVRNFLLALVAGLTVGVGLAFLQESMDNTVKSVEQAEELFGAPVLGVVPADKRSKEEARRLSVVSEPDSTVAEAFRVLRSNLNFVNFQHDITSLLITSSVPDEGKSTVAVNLAVALANAGAKVILVNADFHRPVTDQLLPVDNAIGLSDVLLGSAGLTMALQKSGLDTLLVMNSGRTPPNPSELLGSEKMGDLIKVMKQGTDWIIFDSPPLLAASDTIELTRWVDAVLLVFHSGVSTRESATAGRSTLDKVGARTVGVVGWGFKQQPGGGSYGQYARAGHDVPAEHPDEPGSRG